jgi:hypothetical protein
MAAAPIREDHVPEEYVLQVRRRTGWIVFFVLLALALVFVFFLNRPAKVAGNGASIAISLKTVPAVRSVTVSPGKATFSGCTGGNGAADEKSTSTELGYPNGHCWDGNPGGTFPIKIKYSGPPGKVYVSGSNAVPAAGSTQWSLCNPAAACTGPDGQPGANQYMVKNFAAGRNSSTGLTGTLACDQEFGAQGCSATPGQSQTEGVELIGPESSGNTSPSWTITITWAAGPLGT